MLSARCVREVLYGQATSSRRTPDRTLVFNVFSRLWLPGVHSAVLDGLNRKRGKEGVPEIVYSDDPMSVREITNLEEISAATAAQWNIEENKRILDAYAANANAMPDVAPQETFEQVEAIFRGSEDVLDRRHL